METPLRINFAVREINQTVSYDRWRWNEPWYVGFHYDERIEILGKCQRFISFEWAAAPLHWNCFDWFSTTKPIASNSHIVNRMVKNIGRIKEINRIINKHNCSCEKRSNKKDELYVLHPQKLIFEGTPSTSPSPLISNRNHLSIIISPSFTFMIIFIQFLPLRPLTVSSLFFVRPVSRLPRLTAVRYFLPLSHRNSNCI